MKATLFAVILSFFVISVSTEVMSQEVKPIAPPPLQEQVVKKINLNTATAQELTGSFKGIGKKRAEAIVNYRVEHGEYKSVEDLAQVRGLGKSFVDGHLTQLQSVFSVE